MCQVLNDLDLTSQQPVLIATDMPHDVVTHAPRLPRLQLKGFSDNRSAFVRNVFRLTMENRIDLMLIGHVNYAPLGWLMKRTQPNLRYGVFVYGIDAWQPLGKVRRRAVKEADFVISISEYTKEKAIETNAIDPARTFVVQNALESLNPGTELKAAPFSEGPRLLSVCRLEESEQYKGVDKVIEALPYVARHIPDIKYTVVGGGSDLPRHKRLAQELGVSDRVTFLGFVDDDMLQSCYRDSTVFVMPSGCEGFGFVFLEAMKYQKPVLAAKSGGTPEVVRDGVTGILVEYGNREELVNALISLCLDKATCIRLGEAGYQRLLENFTLPLFKEKLSDILRHELSAEVLYRYRRERLASFLPTSA